MKNLMKKRSKENGKTATAVIVTIIIILILLGIGVVTFVSINGSETVIEEKNNIYSEEKKVEQAVKSALTDGKITDKQTLENALAKQGILIQDDSNIKDVSNGWIYVGESDKFLINKTGEITKNGWDILEDLVHITNGDITFEIGTQISGYSVKVNDKEFGDGNWFILGAKDGKILITTNNNVEEVELGSNSEVSVSQENYLNVVAKLNSIAEKYTNYELANENARIINVDDINRITGYNPSNTGLNHNEGPCNNEAIYRYGNQVTYTKNSDDGYIYYEESNKTVSTKNEKNIKDFTYWTGSEWKTLSNGESATIKNTYYGYAPETLNTSKSSTKSINGSTLAYNLLFDNTNGSEHYYWLGSSFIFTNNCYARYGVRIIGNGFVGGCFLFYSKGTTASEENGIRPVVTLKSDINIDKDGNINK